MFNLLNFQERNSNKVLKFYATVDSVQVFTYADLYEESNKLLEGIRSWKNDSTSVYNIAILLTLHSPALLPAIVG